MQLADHVTTIASGSNSTVGQAKIGLAKILFITSIYKISYISFHSKVIIVIFSLIVK